MTFVASCSGERYFTSLTWDYLKRLQWSPTGEHGTTPHMRYMGARWLKLSFVWQLQHKIP